MTTENLEAKGQKAEVKVPAQGGKVVKTPVAESATVSEITKTPEFMHELDVALGKSTASLQQQVSLSKQATQIIQTQLDAMNATHKVTLDDYKFLESKVADLANEKFVDNPEVAKGFLNTLALELRERHATSREETAKLVEAQQDGFRLAYELGQKSLELQKKYQVPSTVLEACTSVEQMEALAKVFPEIVTEPEKDEHGKPKFVSGGNDGGGGFTPDKDNPSATLTEGFRRLNKK